MWYAICKNFAAEPLTLTTLLLTTTFAGTEYFAIILHFILTVNTHNWMVFNNSNENTEVKSL